MVAYNNLWSAGVLVETISDSSFATFAIVDPHRSHCGLPSYIYAFSIKNLPWVLWAVSSCLHLRDGAWIVEEIAPTSKRIMLSVSEIHVKKYIFSSGHVQWVETFEFITANAERRAEIA